MSELHDVDALPIAWREAGAGPLVVFLGGLGTTRTGFDPQLVSLSDRYRCVCWDTPGFGLSPGPAGGLSYPYLADAVADLITALGATAAHVAGLSMGGQIALHTALRHPGRVRSLALLDTSPAFGLDGTETPGTRPESFGFLRVAFIASASPHCAWRPLRARPDARSDSGGEASEPSPARGRLACRRGVAQEARRGRLSEIASVLDRT